MPVNIKGKLYSTVDERLRDFRKQFPAADGWCLTTEVLHIDDDSVMITARITDPTGRVVGQGHAQEHKAGSRINLSSMLENAETSSWGRALASVGYFGDGNYAVATAEEVEQAIATQGDWWASKLDDYDLTTFDVDRWSAANKFVPWDKWDDSTRNKFLGQLKDGDLTGDIIRKAEPTKKSGPKHDERGEDLSLSSLETF